MITSKDSAKTGVSVAEAAGVNIHLYPSAIVNASRLERISGSLQAAGLFTETHVVGVATTAHPRQEELDGSRTIRRYGVPSSHGEGGASRIAKLLWWFVSVYRAYHREGLGSVSAHSVWTLPLGWLLARRSRAVLAYLPHELETESGASSGPRRLMARLVEGMLLPRCDVVCVVNDGIADWYASTWRIERPLVVRNIPLDSRPESRLRDQLGLSRDDMLYIHTGHLIAHRNIPRILKTFATRPRVHVVFLGQGPFVSDVTAASERCPNIHVLPPVPPDEVVASVREADVSLVLIEPSCLSYRMASPNKLFESLAAYVPPLCTELPEARRLLDDIADSWILSSISELPAAIDSITKDDVHGFQRHWTGLPSWDNEVTSLVTAFRAATLRRAPRGGAACADS